MYLFEYRCSVIQLPSSSQKNVDFTCTDENNVNVGTAKTTVTGTGNYRGTKTFTYTIGKAGNGITGGNAKVTYRKKLKKNKTFMLKGKAQFGKVTYKKTSGNKK